VVLLDEVDDVVEVVEPVLAPPEPELLLVALVVFVPALPLGIVSSPPQA
jgi:hypothetical protein